MCHLGVVKIFINALCFLLYMKKSVDKLILFDVDHTLLKGNEAHHIAFQEAFKKVYNLDTRHDVIDYLGLTDQQIIIGILEHYGVNYNIIYSKLPKCLDEMCKVYGEAIKEHKPEVLSGVVELLDELKGRVVLGLVTGNLEKIAHMKLKKIGIDDYFSVGGFGSDSLYRSELIELAMKKMGIQGGLKNNVFYFGDTLLDIKAAKKAEVVSIGVGTGSYHSYDLFEAGADLAVGSMSERNVIMEFLGLKNKV